MATPDIEFPGVSDDDSDDVRWALETAGAMWSQGDVQEALRWLKKAAETASDEGADMRSLTLAKVAADLRSAIADADPSAATESAAPPPAAAAAPTASAPTGSAPTGSAPSAEGASDSQAGASESAAPPAAQPSEAPSPGGDKAARKPLPPPRKSAPAKKRALPSPKGRSKPPGATASPRATQEPREPAKTVQNDSKPPKGDDDAGRRPPAKTVRKETKPFDEKEDESASERVEAKTVRMDAPLAEALAGVKDRVAETGSTPEASSPPEAEDGQSAASQAPSSTPPGSIPPGSAIPAPRNAPYVGHGEPPSSSSDRKTLVKPLSAEEIEAHRPAASTPATPIDPGDAKVIHHHTVRVSIHPLRDQPGVFLTQILSDKEPAPPGTNEALLVALDPNVKLVKE